MEEITINWYNPYRLDNLKNHSASVGNGIYAIYRKWGDSEKLLHIGKTERDILARVKEYCKK